jgi:hypothetical protein
MEPVTRNGGMIGVTLDYTTNNTYSVIDTISDLEISHTGNTFSEHSTNTFTQNVPTTGISNDEYLVIGYSGEISSGTPNHWNANIVKIDNASGADFTIMESECAEEGWVLLAYIKGDQITADPQPVYMQDTAQATGAVMVRGGLIGWILSSNASTIANLSYVSAANSDAGGTGRSCTLDTTDNPSTMVAVYASGTQYDFTWTGVNTEHVGLGYLNTFGQYEAAEGAASPNTSDVISVSHTTGSQGTAMAVAAFSATGDATGNKKNSGIWDLAGIYPDEFVATPSQVEWTTGQSNTWVVPNGVRSVCILCIGAGGSGSNRNSSDATGGGGGGGGALAYSNDVVVTPGETLTIEVGTGGVNTSTNDTNGNPGSNSSVSNSTVTLVEAEGGGAGIRGDGNFGVGGSAASSTGSVKYSGGDGGLGGSSESGGGGAAAGYSADGADGTDSDATQTGTAGTGGSGGSGGNGLSNDPAGGGGGTGIYGEGTSGAAGVGSGTAGGGGGGGSSGAAGTAGVGNIAGKGGSPGGGGGGTSDDSGETSGDGADGAVRIIWGAGRAYPNTSTANV